MQGDTVRYLSEFLVCESESCFQAVSICHRGYFRELHVEQVGGRLTTHKSVPFDESLQFANFYLIAKLHDQLANTIQAALRALPVNLETVVQAALYSSPLFLEIFNNSPEAIGEYLYLRAIQKGQEMPVVFAFSEALCNALLVNQDRRVGKAYKEACRNSP